MGNSSSKKKDKNQPKGKEDAKGKKEEPKKDTKVAEEQPVFKRPRLRLMAEEPELREPDFTDGLARAAMMEKQFLKKLVTWEVWHMSKVSER